MATETSEAFIKNRATNFIPGPSLRVGSSITKSVVLDKAGFSYNGARNNAIKIKCNIGESIKIIHKDNGGKCHVGVPMFDGKIYVFTHFGAPSVGSINYGFSDKVMYIHNVETPDLLACNGADLVFVCIDHDEFVYVRRIDGKEEILQEIDSPSFAASSRCWMLSTRDVPVGSVLKYGIYGKSNSGGSIFIAETAASNSIPWWDLHGVQPLDGKWRICLNNNLKCHVAARSEDNKKVPSSTGDVVYINGIEQPRLLSFCGDSPNLTAFNRDKNVGIFTLYQDANNTINIYEEESYLRFNCDNFIADPYDPYGDDRINFTGTKLYYYGSKDHGSGDVIYLSKNGWSFEGICGVRPYQSGCVEYIKFDKVGSQVVSCEDFGYSGFFFHVHVSDAVAVAENPEIVNYSATIEKIKNSGFHVWMNGSLIDSPSSSYRFISIDRNYVEGLSGERLQKLVSDKIGKFVYNNKLINNDFLCVRMSNDAIGNGDVIFFNNAISETLGLRNIKFSYDYSKLDKNKINILERAGANFFFDFSDGLITKYPSSLIDGGLLYIDSSASDAESRIKEALVSNARSFLMDGSRENAGKAINIINSFIHPSFNGVYKYYCRRKTVFADQIDVVGLSDHVNGHFRKDPSYSTQYAGLEIFSKVNNLASNGASVCFLLPNGEWNFPYAKMSNWNFSDEIMRDIQDAIFKVENDFNIKIGFSIHAKSLQENEESFKKICEQAGVSRIMIIDASYISDSELIDMHKRLSNNGFKLYLEGRPHTISNGMLSSGFCLGNWVWLSEYRGRMPPYFKGIIREI